VHGRASLQIRDSSGDRERRLVAICVRVSGPERERNTASATLVMRIRKCTELPELVSRYRSAVATCTTTSQLNAHEQRIAQFTEKQVNAYCYMLLLNRRPPAGTDFQMIVELDCDGRSHE
jgi:hypothetical protein